MCARPRVFMCVNECASARVCVYVCMHAYVCLYLYNASTVSIVLLALPWPPLLVVVFDICSRRCDGNF